MNDESTAQTKGDLTRSRILDAAVRCLVDGGIDEVRIARVARLAGVSSALVHYHFETREALLGQALSCRSRSPGRRAQGPVTAVGRQPRDYGESWRNRCRFPSTVAIR